MIKELEAVGYEVTHESGGPLTDDEIKDYNDQGIWIKGQKGIPRPRGKDAIPVVVIEEPQRDHIVRVKGHDKDTTIYVHDKDSITDLVRHASDES